MFRTGTSNRFGMTAGGLPPPVKNIETLPQPKSNMKIILLLICGLFLVSSTGCITSHEEWLGHARNERLVECIAGPPVVAGSVPVVEVRPPETIGR
jgi:hypothetical protein